MTPVSLLFCAVAILAVAGASAVTRGRPFLRRSVLLVSGLIVFLFLVGNLLTPWTWKWTTSNLQVKIYNARNKRNQEGSECEGFGWSKLDLFFSERIGSGTWRGAHGTIASSTEVHISSIFPNGVSVRVRYDEKTNGTSTSFTKTIFVPARGLARVDATPDFYITGSFED